MKVKLCGIRSTEDIAYLNAFPPDYAGFVFAPSRRIVTREEAARLRLLLRPSIQAVGVFVNAPLQEVEDTARLARLDAVQLHGDESQDYIAALRKKLPGVSIWKAVRIQSRQDILNAQDTGADLLLYDAYTRDFRGGTGERADWRLIWDTQKDRRFFLAGGLDAGNLEEAVETVSPYGVDLSSGIETGGKKDYEKIKAVMETVERLRRCGK